MTDPCERCGLRSCRVTELVERLAKRKMMLTPAQLRAAEREITEARNNCDDFSKARKKPSQPKDS